MWENILNIRALVTLITQNTLDLDQRKSIKNRLQTRTASEKDRFNDDEHNTKNDQEKESVKGRNIASSAKRDQKIANELDTHNVRICALRVKL